MGTRLSFSYRWRVCLRNTRLRLLGEQECERARTMFARVVLGFRPRFDPQIQVEAHLDGETPQLICCINEPRSAQKLNFKANWIILGLLLAEMMRPKLPPSSTRPVVGSMRPPEAARAFRLLMGLAKFG